MMNVIQIIDVIFCALLIRFLIGWLLTNRQVARFMLIVFSLTVFVIIVNQLELPLTKTLTSAISLPLGLIVTLIFLPDLRRAFQEKRLKKLFLLFKSEKNDVSHSLLDALVDLARTRCGALIVIAGDDELEPLLSGGEEYDAQITKSLILSIFNTHSPRHDGAIVIQENRILRAGAVLPLSRTEHGDERWGTRHLAALGLSEHCDATVLVVSEERGSISLAREGTMKVLRSDSIEAISDAIEDVLHPEIEKGTKKKLLGLTVGLWLAAFLLAFGAFGLNLWIERPLRGLQTNEELLIISQTAIHFKNIPKNLYLTDYSADSCRVYVRVPIAEANLFPKKLELTVDLSDMQAGKSDIQLTRRMLSAYRMETQFSETWKISRFEPERLQIALAEEQDAQLRVVPQFTALAPEFSLRSILVSPASLSVRVKGALAEDEQRVKTLPINLSRIDEPGKYQYASSLELPPSIRLLDLDDEDTVRVDVVVERTIPEAENGK